MLLALGVTERAAMGIMGWSSTAMAARYQHMTDPIRRDIAKRVGGLLWAPGGDTIRPRDDEPVEAARPDGEEPAGEPEGTVMPIWSN